MKENELDVFGLPLEPCCYDPMTGYFRDGFCKTIDTDTGTHVLCARVTAEFLAFSKERGNDLTTPITQWQFPGLNQGFRPYHPGISADGGVIHSRSGSWSVESGSEKRPAGHAF